MEVKFTPRRVCTTLLLLAAALTLSVTTHGQEPLPDRARMLDMHLHEPAPRSQDPVVRSAESFAPEGMPLWQSESVTSEGIGPPSLALDRAKQPHIAFYAGAGNDGPLRYAYHDGTGWQVEPVDGESGTAVSLALNTHGHPRIAYSSGGMLKYAYRDGTGWHVEPTAIAGGNFPSLAIGNQGHPHLSYHIPGVSNLGYAYHDGSDWHTQTVAGQSVSIGAISSLAVDSAGHPHIGYLDRTNDALMYLHHDGATWQRESIEVRLGTGEAIDIALDSNGHPHISYYRQHDHQVRYAYRDRSAWHTEIVHEDWTVVVDLFTSLALDAGDNPHIGYYRQSGTIEDDISYAYRDATGWHRETVYESPMIGLFASLAIGADGQPRIAYSSRPGLEYAARISDVTDWSRLTFATFYNLNYEIFTAAGDGSDPIQRTSNTVTDTTPEYNRGATRIVFVSDRNGNPEIYKMNANGTGQTRLTWTADGDYLPTWSPDSSQIAFYSYRTGNAQVFVMNANGSSQTQLTESSAWDGHPTWSPDGSQIAFVSNRSGQYELWTMDADGSNEQQLTSGLNGAAYPDWSPDGSRIAFNYDRNGDGWLDLAIINADGTGLTRPLGNSPYKYDQLGPAWAPHGNYLAFAKIKWTSYMDNWYWVDAYIHRLDVADSSTQLLAESDRNWWPDWQPTDALLPSSALEAPAWSGNASFAVRWSGSDAGPSGLQSYDVQYRDGAGGTWTDWYTGTLQTTAVFTGDYEHTYYFRCRGRDYAENVEPYPGGDGDASTHVYRHALDGSALGNREQPVLAATIESSPSALNVASSGAGGDFALYYDQHGAYDVSASRQGFGALPAMKSVLVTDTYTVPVFYLPPTDDQVSDGGFEAGSLSPAWTLSGEITAVLTTTAHTGDYAVMLGGPISPTLPVTGPWRSVIEQEITVPPTLTSPTLSLLYWIEEANPLSDTLQVRMAGAAEATTTTVSLATNLWTHQWWDLSAWEGPTLTLRVEWTQAEADRSVGLILDEVSLGSAATGVYPVYLPLVMRNGF